MKAALVSLALTGGFFCFYVCRWKIVKHWPEIINDELDHEKIKMNQTKRTIKAILIGIIVLPLTHLPHLGVDNRQDSVH